MKTQPNLILLRHGISYTNEGRSVDNEQQILLSVRGVMGTLEAAKTYRQENPTLHFDHVFMSPYKRAVQTALNFLSVFENKPVDLTVVDNFRERTFGFENFTSMRDLVHQYGVETVDSWDTHLDTKPHPNGESQNDVYARSTAQYIQEVLPRIKRGETCLVVAHYYVLKALSSFINQGNALAMTEVNPKNCLPYEYFVEI